MFKNFFAAEAEQVLSRTASTGDATMAVNHGIDVRPQEPPRAATRILLVDDHRMFREALVHMLSKVEGLEVVGEAGTADVALQLAAILRPDVIVLDISLPDLNGVEVAERLRLVGSGARVVALSAFSERRFIVSMLRAGAMGYVTKSAATSELVRAVQAVAAGRNFLSTEAAGAMVDQIQDRANTSASTRLGRREREVLRLVSEGMRTNAISESLHIAASTVEVHRRNIMRKLELHTVAQLTKYAIREGITAS